MQDGSSAIGNPWVSGGQKEERMVESKSHGNRCGPGRGGSIIIVKRDITRRGRDDELQAHEGNGRFLRHLEEISDL